MILFKSILQEAEKKELTYDYGCILAEVNPTFWNKLLTLIDKEDIYDNQYKEYGLEKEPHVTILFGLHLDTTKASDVESFIKKNIQKSFDIMLEEVSVFEMDEKPFDVLKFKAKSNILVDLNKKARETFDYTNEFPYSPHVTIAYIKKGKGKKYIEKFSNIKNVHLECDAIVYSERTNNQRTTVKLKDK